MFNYFRIIIYTIFFVLLTAPTIVAAIPVTYQFDAIDWYKPDQTFTGTISFESSTSAVQNLVSISSSYPGYFYYENAIISISLNYGGNTITQYGGSIRNDCSYDPFFSISTPSPIFIELALPSCLPGADQDTLSNLDLSVLNDIISHPYPALTHPGLYLDQDSNYSPFAHPFNFRLLPQFVSEPGSLLLLALGVGALGFVRGRRQETVKLIKA